MKDAHSLFESDIVICVPQSQGMFENEGLTVDVINMCIGQCLENNVAYWEESK